jgi:hypothetical protein
VAKKRKRARIGLGGAILILVSLFFSLNFFVQIVRHPAEALGMVGLGKSRSISQTWRDFSDEFQEHSTAIMTPTFLAAMAQVESGGNPLATPKWRFRRSDSVWRWFAPESTSVGLFQFTTGTYEKAKKFCIHEGRVARDGPWYDPSTCWFNWTYLRISASDSIEMASAYLHRAVKASLGNRRSSLQNQRRLAAIIHLCGAGKARAFIQSGFSLSSIRYCGRHSVEKYVKRIERHDRQLRARLPHP